MNFRQHGLDVRLLALVLRAERVEHRLVFTRRHQSALDAQLVHQSGEAKTVHEHANAAHQTGFVDIDVVGRRRDVVRSRRAGFFHDGIDLLAVHRLEAMDLVVDDAGLHRAATRRIDQQHHRLGTIVLKGLTNGRHHVLGAGLGLGGDFAADFHHRRVGRGSLVRDLARLKREPDSAADQRQPEQATEPAPAPGRLLLAQTGHQEFLDGRPFPAGCGNGSRRLGQRGDGMGGVLFGHDSRWRPSSEKSWFQVVL